MNNQFKYRCSICDTVSEPSISNSMGNFKHGTQFFPDPKDPNHFICGECNHSHQEDMSTWNIIDEDKTHNEQERKDGN